MRTWSSARQLRPAARKCPRGDFSLRRFPVLVHLAAVGLLAALGSLAFADERGESRVWTDASGKFQLEARLVKVVMNVAYLEREDGRVVQVPIGLLSDADRVYLVPMARPAALAEPEPSDVPAPEGQPGASATAPNDRQPPGEDGSADKAPTGDESKAADEKQRADNQPADGEKPAADEKPADGEKPPLDVVAFAADLQKYLDKRYKTDEEVTADDFRQMETWLAKMRAQSAVTPSGEMMLHLTHAYLAHPGRQTDEDWEEQLAVMERWRQAFPKSATPLVIQARSYISWGWQSRGSGFALTVTEEGWRLFHERIAKARELLEAADKLPHNDPDVYVQLIIVCKADSAPREEVNRWLARAQQIDARYYYTYAAMAEYLLPRWHGEPGEVERFAAEIAKKLGGKDGLDAYARILLQVNCYEPDVLRRPTISLPMLEEAVKEQRIRYPASPRFLNFAAAVAWSAENRPLALELRDQIADKVDLQVWGGQARYQMFLRWCDPNVVIGGRPLTAEPDVARLAWSPDGKLLATLGPDSQAPLKLWDAQTQRLTRQFGGCQTRLSCVAFDPQGQGVVAANSEGSVFLWRMDQPNEPRTLKGHTESVLDLAWSADGQTLATSGQDRAVRLWDPVAGKEKLHIELPIPGEKICLSADGRRLAVYGGSRFQVWDAAEGRLVHEAPSGETDTLPDFRLTDPLKFLDDGTVMAIGRSPQGAERPTRLLTLDPATGERKEILYEDVLDQPAVSGDGRLFASGQVTSRTLENGATRHTVRVRLVDLEQGLLLGQIGITGDKLTQLAFAPDGSLLAISVDSSVKILPMAPPRKAPPQPAK